MLLYMWDTVWFWWLIWLEYLQYMSFFAKVLFMVNISSALRIRGMI